MSGYIVEIVYLDDKVETEIASTYMKQSPTLWLLCLVDGGEKYINWSYVKSLTVTVDKEDEEWTD